MCLSVDKHLKWDKSLGSVYLSTEAHLIEVVDTAPSKSMRTDEIAIETAKIGKLTAVIAVMSILCRKRCNLWCANLGNGKPSHQKAESDNVPVEKSRKPRNLFQKTRKGWISKKLAPILKKIELKSTNLKLYCK
jgi:hypothetical protein